MNYPCGCPDCKEERKALRIQVGRKVCFGFLLSFFVLAIFFLLSSTVHASQISEDKAVRILVGEAANQGEIGMICVAEVLRKKGSTQGFYGLNAKHSHKEPAWVWAQARKAWASSLHTNYTQGANHFENIKAFGCPSWAKNCVQTFKYKDHVFYKEA